MKKITGTALLALLLLAFTVLPAVAIGVTPSINTSDDEAWKEKLDSDTLTMVEAMSDDDVLPVFCHRKNFNSAMIESLLEEKFVEITGFDYKELFTDGSEEEERFINSLIAEKEAALGLPSGSLDKDSPEAKQAISEGWDYAYSVITRIKRDAYTSSNQAFVDAHIAPTTEILYFSNYTCNLIIVASKAEIISMAKDDSCVDISYFVDEEQVIPEDDSEISLDETSDEISFDDTSNTSDDEAWKEKLDSNTLTMVEAMSDDDVLPVFCHRKNFNSAMIESLLEEKFVEITGFDYKELFTDGSEEEERFINSLIAEKEAALGLPSGSLDKDSPEAKQAISEGWDYAYSVITRIKRDAYTSSNQAFVDAHIAPTTEILHFSNYTSSLIIVASKAEIISMAKDDSCVRISYFVREEQIPEDDSEISLDETSDEISFDDTSEEISLDDTSDEASLDETSDEISFDDTSDEASFDDTSDEASFDDTSDEISFDDTSDEISFDDTSDEISLDDTSDEASLDDTSDDISFDGTSNGGESSNGTVDERAAGDANGDGNVNSLDAAQVLKSDARLISLNADAVIAADVNGDSKVDSLDAALILKLDAGLITGFAA